MHASETDIGYSRITPASPFYFLKTIREDLELKLAGTPHVKLIRELEFATVRIREVRSLVAVNQDLIVPTLENYQAILKNISQEPDLDTHIAVLMQVYDNASNLNAKMAIRSSLNKLILREDVSKASKLSICNLFYREASSSSLNQTEKFVLLGRAQKCQNSNK